MHELRSDEMSNSGLACIVSNNPDDYYLVHTKFDAYSTPGCHNTQHLVFDAMPQKNMDFTWLYASCGMSKLKASLKISNTLLREWRQPRPDDTYATNADGTDS